MDDLRQVKPIYESVPGWSEDLTACRSMDDFPAAAIAYLDRVSELVGRPVSLVSVGPGRDQTILLGDLAPMATAG